MTDQELSARFASIEESIRAEAVVTRRHFDVVAEGLRIDIKIVAEGHDTLQQKTDDLKDGLSRVEVGQQRLEVRQTALEHRQGRLEERQGKLEGRQGKLEDRQGKLEERQEGLENQQRALTTEVRGLAARLFSLHGPVPNFQFCKAVPVEATEPCTSSSRHP